MTAPPKTPLPADLFKIMAEGSAMPQMIARQADSLLKAQADMLDGIEALTKDWLRRRREDNETAIKAAERMCECGDVNDALVAYCDWLGGSFRRLANDATAISEQALAIAAAALSATGTAPAEAKAVKPRAKAGKKAKAIPVKAAKAEEPAQPEPRPRMVG